MWIINTLTNFIKSAKTCSLYIARPPTTSFAGINLATSVVSHPLPNCRLYYSQVTVDPQKSIDYVQRNRNKKVIYRSFVTNSYTNITTGSSFNALVNSGIVHPVQIENMNTCAYKPTCTCTYTCMHIYRHTCKPLVYIFYQNLHKYTSTYIHASIHTRTHAYVNPTLTPKP